MCKKFLSLFLILCLTAALTVFPVAAADITYSIEKDKIILSGQTDVTAADVNASVVLLKKDVSYQQFLDATPEQSGELAYAMKTVKTATGGAISVEIPLPKDSEHMSMIVILGDAAFNEATVMTVIYATEDDIADLVTAFNAANTSEEIISFLNEYEQTLGVIVTKEKQNNAFYSYLASKSATADGEQGLNQIVSFYNDGMLKESIAQAKNVEDIKTAVSNYDAGQLFSNEDLELVDERELDEALSELLSGRTYSEAQDAVDRLNESIFLTLFNNSDSRDEMISLFEKYNDSFVHVNTATGTNYAKADKAELFRTIAAQAARSPFQDGDALKTAIDKAATPSGGPGTGGQGGTGSGTGGGSIGGGTVDVYPTPTPAPVSFTFSDLDSVKWAEDSIYSLVEKGVIAEDPSKLFRPDDSITRQEYVKLLVTALDIYDASATCDFIDVGEEDWFYPYIASAVSKGLVKGISDTEFGTDSNITREDIATLTYRAAQSLGIQLGDSQPEKQFADAQSISDYAREAIENMAKAGILNGYEDNTFRPKNTATRAESAVIISKFLMK